MSGKSFNEAMNEAVQSRASSNTSQQNHSFRTTKRYSSKYNAGVCPTCGNLDLDAVLTMKPAYWGTLVLDLGPAEGNWVRTKCEFCQMLAGVRPLREPGDGIEPLALYAFRQSRYLFPINSRGVILAVIPTRDGGVQPPTDISTFFPVLSGAMKPEISPSQRQREISRFLCPVDPSAPVQNGGKMRGRLVDPENVDYSLLKSWINTCVKRHGDSCKRPETQFMYRPKFINCHTRKIEDTSPAGGYVALSYVWGDTQAANDIVNGSSLRKNLPATIEDAITVTKRLDYAYLWIDRYCTSQHDQETKMQQIQQMDLIYQHAEVVIIAAIGDDPTHGLPGAGGRAVRIRQPHASRGGHQLASTMRDPRQVIPSSTWAKRAWTYQEGLLARRRLVFTEEQVYFECWAMNCRESVHLDVNAAALSYFVPKPGLRSPGAGGRAILENISSYTERKLKVESDMLNAFLGILKLYARSEPPVHSYWGVPILPSSFRPRPEELAYTPTLGFLSGLCWETLIPGRRRPGFPSWSWAGWKDTHVVSPHSREYIVGVKLISSADVEVSVFHGGYLQPWERMWLKESNRDWIRQDLPQCIHISAWTTDAKLVHSTYFTASDMKRTPKFGFYAYPVGTRPTSAETLTEAVTLTETVALTEAPANPDDSYRDPTGDTYLGVFLGRTDPGSAELFVLILKRCGEYFERVGSVQFSMAHLAARVGWFDRKKRRTIKLR
jgi:hypothetical protein